MYLHLNKTWILNKKYIYFESFGDRKFVLCLEQKMFINCFDKKKLYRYLD